MWLGILALCSGYSEMVALGAAEVAILVSTALLALWRGGGNGRPRQHAMLRGVLRAGLVAVFIQFSVTAAQTITLVYERNSPSALDREPAPVTQRTEDIAQLPHGGQGPPDWEYRRMVGGSIASLEAALLFWLVLIPGVIAGLESRSAFWKRGIDMAGEW